VAGRIAGQVTSAAFGYRVGRPVALGYLEAGLVEFGDKLDAALDIAGQMSPAIASLQAAFDPRGQRMRP